MKMNDIWLSIISVQFVFNIGVSAAEDSLEYRPLFEIEGGFEVDLRNQTISFGHVISKVTTCDYDGDFICFLGGGQDFVFPMLGKCQSPQDTWKYGDYRYVFRGIISQPLFGMVGQYMLVDRLPSNTEDVASIGIKRFVYSRERGVVAIAIVEQERRTVSDASELLPGLWDVLILNGKIGIAAQDVRQKGCGNTAECCGSPD